MIEKKFYSNQDLLKNGKSKGFTKCAEGSLKLGASKGKALFYSDVICAKEEETLWSHIHLSISQYRTFQVFICMDDNKERILAMKDEKDFINHALIKGNQKDILLFDKGLERGKYLRFLLRCYALKEEDIYFYGYNVTFMEEDIIHEMAHPFHQNYDLMKYLSIYQQGFHLIKKKQERFIANMNLKVCDYMALIQLAKWLGVERAEKLEESVLRDLLIHNSYLQKYKGCLCYYQKLASILWKEEVIVQEVENEIRIIARKKESTKIEAFKERMNMKFPPFIKVRYQFLSQKELDDCLYLNYNSYLLEDASRLDEQEFI